MLKCVEAEIANYEACLKEEVEKRKKFKVWWLMACFCCRFSSLKASVWGVFMSKWRESGSAQNGDGEDAGSLSPYQTALRGRAPARTDGSPWAALTSLRRMVEHCSWATAEHQH